MSVSTYKKTPETQTKGLPEIQANSEAKSSSVKNGSKNISEVRYNVKNFNIDDFEKKAKDNSV